MIVGVTGPSGAGKSTFSSYLKEKGFYILDADLIVGELYKENKDLLKKIKKEFPFVFSGDVLDKKILAEFVFSNKLELEKLASICNPFVLEFLGDEIKKHSNFNIVIDAITLFESGANLFCEKIITIIAKKEQRLKRIIKRDNISMDMALKRFYCQNDDKFYIERSDIVLENDYCYDSFKKKVDDMFREWNLF